MKPLTYVVVILLIGLGNAGATRSILQFLKDTSLPLFSFASAKEGVSMADKALAQIKKSTKPSKMVLGYTARQRAINAYYFPGAGPEYAFVIGGMHGSELSSIEVVQAVVDSLSAGILPYFNVVVIPELFPDNAAVAAAHPTEIGSLKNIGRYTSSFTADPNRQMPPLGNPFIPDHPVDFAGRFIEKENQALLYLIQNLHPERIASVHAIRNEEWAGVFADPRTDGYGYAHGFFEDSLLAVYMALRIQQLGGMAQGNKLDSCPSALYHTDPSIAPKGAPQLRNTHGSNSSHRRSFGVSLGGWASTAERAYEESLVPRTAAMVFTVEFPGSRRSVDFAAIPERLNCQKNVAAYASAIVSVLLQNNTQP